MGAWPLSKRNSSMQIVPAYVGKSSIISLPVYANFNAMHNNSFNCYFSTISSINVDWNVMTTMSHMIIINSYRASAYKLVLVLVLMYGNAKQKVG